VPDVQQEVQILLLLGIGSRGREQGLECLRLIVESRDVRDARVLLVHLRPVGELHLADGPFGLAGRGCELLCAECVWVCVGVF
jgi:hypothetical protein